MRAYFLLSGPRGTELEARDIPKPEASAGKLVVRVRYGPLELDVEPGEHRALSPDEVARLQRAAARTTRKPA